MRKLNLFPNTRRRYQNKTYWVNRRVNYRLPPQATWSPVIARLPTRIDRPKTYSGLPTWSRDGHGWVPPPPPPPPLSDGLKEKKVAIIFFGLTRSLGETVDSIKNNLFAPLHDNGMSYDIFVHTYRIFGEYQNIWAREHTTNYINEDVKALLNPKYFIWDDQKKVESSINFNEYYKKLGNWTFEQNKPDLTKYLIKNMCLALYSKKKIIEIFDKNKSDYDYAIIMRPDLRLDNKIVCIGKPEIISYCGKLFDGLKSYSERKSIISERYFLDKLKEKSILPLGLNIEYTALRIKK